MSGDARQSPSSTRPPVDHGDEVAVVRVLRAAGRRLRTDPSLAVPFVVLGVVLALADELRRSDPLPVDEHWTLTDDGLDVSLDHSTFPTGVPGTIRPPGALVDLHAEYLLWGAGIELAVLLAIGLAGWLTFARALGDAARRDRRFAYVGVVVAVFGLSWLAAVDVTLPVLLWLPVLALLLFVQVRLFLVPVAVVAGESVRGAVRESNRRVRGKGHSVLGLVLVFGLVAWLLGAVPHVGALLSAAVVAPVQAIAAVVVFERTAGDA